MKCRIAFSLLNLLVGFTCLIIMDFSICSPAKAQTRITSASSPYIMLYTTGRYSECARTAKRLYATKEEFSLEDALCMAIGSAACIMSDDPEGAIMLYDAATKNERIWEMDLSAFDISGLTDDEKKFLLTEYLSEYTDRHWAEQIISFARRNLKEEREELPISLMDGFSEVVFKNRKLFSDASSLSDFLNLCKIYSIESSLLSFDRCHEIPDIIMPELLLLSQNSKHKLNDMAVYSVFENAMPMFCNLVNLTNCREYIPLFADCTIKLRELKNRILGMEQSNSWYANDVSWQSVARHLKENECAITTFYSEVVDALTQKINLTGLLIIQSYPKIPKIVFSTEDSIVDLPSFLDNSDYSQHTVYFCPGDDMDYYNWTNSDQRIHLCFSLYDLVRRNNESPNGYSGRNIRIYANMDYGVDDANSIHLEPLRSGSELIDSTRALFGDKVQPLQGAEVKRINFLDLNDDIDIFHLSTHGLDMGPAVFDSSSFLDDLLDEKNQKRFGFALSGYHSDRVENMIDGSFIKDLRLDNLDLVYLDICSSTQSDRGFFNTFSLAKSFYCAGANRIIAYSSSVNEDVANKFALTFYSILYTTPGISYHDAFYLTKKAVLNQYANSLKKDRLGRPTLDIVLWE